jgi:hypothetical protein
MQGRDGRLDKHPWTTVEPPRGPVEVEFLRQLALGESVAPFRMLETVTAVIPLRGDTVLDAAAARASGNRHLAAWLSDVEDKWMAHANRAANGQPRMTISAQIDYMRKLSSQSNSSAAGRVLYTKAGTRLSAAILVSQDAIVDHRAYWANVRSSDEGAYLIAILNSAFAVAKISDLQGIGEAGTKRDFDNLVWTLPIPEAASVNLPETQHFVAKRKAIRDALINNGIAAEIEALVDALLPP